ncbi:hypothetical protein N7490_006037 [Penicillium lividum]|nr:hypothetical protein N7490_006037 [Penicillium lividum]
MAKKQDKKEDKKPVSFDEIIQSDREKKKHQELANSILGKKRNERRASAPAAGVQKTAKPASLASRIGPKRAASTANLRGNQPKPKPAAATRPSAQAKRPIQSNRDKNAGRILAAVDRHTQATVSGPKGGLSIKGASGPFIVVGSNFAAGTTAADIQSALESTTGPMLSCRVIDHHPTVTAEFVFENKFSAESLVANFHNQRADGRILSMVLKPTGSAINNNVYSNSRAQADRERQNRRDKRRVEPAMKNGHFEWDEDVKPSYQNKSGPLGDTMMIDSPQPRRNNNQNRQRR